MIDKIIAIVASAVVVWEIVRVIALKTEIAKKPASSDQVANPPVKSKIYALRAASVLNSDKAVRGATKPYGVESVE
jgi:hypothetical protein